MKANLFHIASTSINENILNQNISHMMMCMMMTR